MIKLYDILDVAELNRLIEEGYISRKSHNEYPLSVLNYTPAATFDEKLVWGTEMNLSRGLIYNTETLEIVARPFPKFWNINDTRHPETLEANLPQETPLCLDKLDGSLGVLFKYEGLNHVATRGSFHSEQSIWATKWLRLRYPRLYLPDGNTVCTEIIYHENKIVIDYDFEGLVVLGVIDIATGKERGRDDVKGYCRAMQLPVVREFTKSLADCLAEDIKNREGYVLSYSNGLKIKCKFSSYIRLHKILTGLNIHSVWELLRDGHGATINDWLQDELMPETFKTWVKSVWIGLTEQYETIYNEVNKIYVDRPKIDQFMAHKESRKKMAEYFTHESVSKYSGLLFGMLDGKNIDTMIWRMIEPKGNAVYKKEVE